MIFQSADGTVYTAVYNALTIRWPIATIALDWSTYILETPMP
jgi:hypothetical protein